MERVDEVKWEKAAAALRARLTRLSEASLHINESLEMETVLQGALDSARSLTGARYGVLSTVDETGELEELLASNLTPEEFRGLQEIPGGLEFFEYLSGLAGPLRVADLSDYACTLGLSGFDLAAPACAFLTGPFDPRVVRINEIFRRCVRIKPSFAINSTVVCLDKCTNSVLEQFQVKLKSQNIPIRGDT